MSMFGKPESNSRTVHLHVSFGLVVHCIQLDHFLCLPPHVDVVCQSFPDASTSCK